MTLVRGHSVVASEGSALQADPIQGLPLSEDRHPKVLCPSADVDDFE